MSTPDAATQTEIAAMAALAPEILTLTAESTARLAALAQSFPCLRGLPGVEPFDAVTFASSMPVELPESDAMEELSAEEAEAIIDRWIVTTFVAWLYDMSTRSVSSRAEPPPEIEQHARLFVFSLLREASPASRAAVAAWMTDGMWFPLAEPTAAEQERAERDAIPWDAPGAQE